MGQYDLPYTGPQVEALLAKISELESEMPSKTSDLTNDSGFITSADVPTKTSDLNNDSGFITNAPVAAEAARAQAAEALLATISSLQAEISRATGVEGTLQDLIDGIAAKIPSAATEQNQLADKSYVNASIATASATFRGTYISLVALQSVAADENDYGYVISTDSVGNTIYNRYKYANSTWTFEYAIANPVFDSSQWAAINSAVTAELVAKLSALPDNATLTAALAAKQDVIDDLSSIRSKANSAYQKPSGGIPASDIADGVIPDVSGKVNTSDIADNLTTNDATKVLSAKQGKVLNENLTQLGQELNGLSITNAIRANGGTKALANPLPIGITITSIEGFVNPNRYVVLYDDSSDTTGTRVSPSNLPYITTKAYTRWQAYDSGSPDVTMVARIPSVLDDYLKNSDIPQVVGLMENIRTSSNPYVRGFFVNADLSLQSSSSWAMTDPILVRKGEIIKVVSSGTGVRTYAILGVDSSTPITSISDVRNFEVLVNAMYGSQGVSLTTEWTAQEDTYVIAQYWRATSIELGYNPIVDRVLELEASQEIMSEEIEQLAKNGNINESWVSEEISTMVTKMRALSKHKILAFAFATDQHFSQASTGTETDAAIIRGLRSIPQIAGDFPLDLVVLGGDEAGYGGAADNNLQGIADDVAEVRNAAYTPKCPVIAMAGNHDAYQNMGAANSDGYQEYNWKIRGNVVRRELDWAGVRSTNCWYDDETSKVRFVFLDGYSVVNGQTLAAMVASADNELTRCIDSSLSDDKLKNSEWRVIIFSHNVIAEAGTNQYQPMGEAFWTKIKAYADAGVDIVACINGHAHNIAHGVKDDVLFICVNQGLPVTSPTSPAIRVSFDGNTYTNVLGTAKETAYQIFVLDETEGKLYAFQFGAGTDRVFNTTPGQRGIELDELGGVVSSSETIAGGTIKATNHNTEYSVTLDSTGSYSFPYLCPGLTWRVDVVLPGGQTASQTYDSETGTHTLNISI